MTKTTIILDDILHNKMKTYCKENGFSYSGLISVLLRERLDAEE